MIKAYENTLKHIIVDVLGASDKTNYNISDDIKEKWLEKRNFESLKSTGSLNERRIIFYADFYDLKIIIKNNWEKFEPIFKSKERFLVFFDEVNDYKNAIDLGLSLTKSQEEILSGIIADVKNSHTIYSNKNSNRNDYFVLINQVTDNVGTVWNNVTSEEVKNPVLTVGDEYELLVEANDPKDREIEYEIYHFTGSLRINQKNNRFNFKITEDLIGLNTILIIKATTPSSEYKNEFILKIKITVVPN